MVDTVITWTKRDRIEWQTAIWTSNSAIYDKWCWQNTLICGAFCSPTAEDSTVYGKTCPAIATISKIQSTMIMWERSFLLAPNAWLPPGLTETDPTHMQTLRTIVCWLQRTHGHCAGNQLLFSSNPSLSVCVTAQTMVTKWPHDYCRRAIWNYAFLREACVTKKNS